ncbi:Acetyltransferase (GNAT) family protein [Saccharicrinis carchari]|uniref:Acetyltransferase (GNAT) family protein n=1 Tax=Saccharicrinis carchari TaxID=1168039 RepID=A0A521DKW3_SACCC|nr:GNAT family N-acetyltransferase [Saccharicrinis carchari]SMO71570.1 Acetyltransferase (GNAT) family protein [Saccharicrinis carchari]
MSVQIVEVKNTNQRKKFVDFPYKLYKNNTCWVPAMRADELGAISPDKNPAYDFSKAKFWLAYQDGQVVGRIGAIVNDLWISKIGKKIGRITRMEFINNFEVVKRLFETAECWLKEQGMVGAMGPLGFSNLDHSGLLIEGHEYIAVMASDYHHAYYQSHIEKLGYTKETDWLEFRITFPEALPEKSLKISEMIKKRYGLKILNFNSRNELEPYREQIFKVFNDAFVGLFGTFRLPDRLVKFYINKFFPALNPRYVKVMLDKEDELAGFVVALPSLSVALQKAKGRLLPFGWWHLKNALEKPKEMDLMLTGVKPELQKMGGVSLLMNELWKTANDEGIRFVETTGMLEDNKVAIQLWKSFDHIQHKRKRCYKKMF